MESPEHFLKIVFHHSTQAGDNLALCAGFERGVWRGEQLASHIVEWLPEFALKYSEIEELGHHNALKIIKRAAKTVYQTDKYCKRGEFGEILLHIAMRQVYDTLPAVSKIYYKTASNETVKGFDAVHVVRKTDGLELWIGETKFYKEIRSAIRDVVDEIVDHLETDYLKSEFILIGNKIDPAWPESDSLQRLLSENISLDEVFENVCIPVLITYESLVVANTSVSNDDYVKRLKQEVLSEYESLREGLDKSYRKRFSSKLPIVVHVFFVPLADKSDLIGRLDAKLKGLQL
jgi:hypothetical protein